VSTIARAAGAAVSGAATSLVVDLTAAPYRADPTGVVAFDDAMDAAIAAVAANGPTNPTGASARTGGVIYLPPGYYKQTRAHTIATTNVVVRGAGRQATQIILDTTFPTGTTAWNLSGSPDGATVFASRVEDLTVNCRGIVGSVGVESLNGQEGSGLRGVRVRDFRDGGILLHSSSSSSSAKPAEMLIEDCEVWAAPGGANYGIKISDCSSTIYLRDITLLALGALGSATWQTAVDVTTAIVHAENLHVEKFVDGIVAGTSATLVANSITGGNGPGASAGTAMVRLPASVPNRAHLTSINNVNGNSIYDERSSQTIGSGVHELYVVDHTADGLEPIKFSQTVAVRKVRGTRPALFLKDNLSTSSTASLQQWVDSVSAVKAEMMTNGLLRLGLNANSTTNWSDGHLQLGPYHLWVDSSGRLRVKSGAPTSDTDGTVVGTQT
jgi:hypothetical protein